MTNEQFIQTLIQIDACNEALDWVRTTPGTPEELWNKCNRKDWLEFLIRESNVSFDWAKCNRQVDQLRPKYDRQVDQLRAEYDRQVDQLWAECNRQVDQLWAEYDRQVAQLWAEYDRQVAQLWAEYDRQVKPLRAEYDRQVDQLWAEYDRQVCAAIRSMILWTDIAKALGNAG
jgi:hypothetical protein